MLTFKAETRAELTPFERGSERWWCVLDFEGHGYEVCPLDAGEAAPRLAARLEGERGPLAVCPCGDAPTLPPSDALYRAAVEAIADANGDEWMSRHMPLRAPLAGRRSECYA